MLNKEFLNAWKQEQWNSRVPWLCWLGQPLLFDGGLCVNRTSEELGASKALLYKWPNQ